MSLNCRLLNRTRCLNKCLYNSVNHGYISKRSFTEGFSTRAPKTKLFLLAVGTFTATSYGGHVYDQWKLEKARKEAIKSQLLWDSESRKFKPSEYTNVKATDPKLIEKIREIPVSRTVSGPTKIPGDLKLTLFQYQTCPFCCKVRAFLDYYGIPYDVVEVNPVLRKQIKFSDYRKVPILVASRKETDAETKNSKATPVENPAINAPMQLVDSSLIISLMGTYLLCNPNLEDNLNDISGLYQTMSYSSLDDNLSTVNEVVNKYFLMKGDTLHPVEQKSEINRLKEERKWREWADTHLVHALSPNIYRTMEESIESFKNFSAVGDWERLFPTWERILVIYVGASAMYLIGKKLRKKYLLKEDVRESLYDYCRQWTKAVGKDRLFMGGTAPNLADLAVYGVLNSIEGCSAFSDLLKHTNIGSWYNACKEAVANQSGHAELGNMFN